MEEFLNKPEVAVAILIWIMYQAFYAMPRDLEEYWAHRREANKLI